MADPVEVDAGHYSVEFENDKVRVLRVKYGPGEKSAMHSHPYHIGVTLTDVKFRMHNADGSSEDMELTAGAIVEGEAGEHLPENLSDQPFEAVLVEVKG